MTIFCVCVPYFSLPEFPNSCSIIGDPSVLPRDILLCNKTNNIHLEGGMQYDPNIESGEYRLCEPRVRRSLKKNASDYDELYIIFRTRHMKLDNTRKYLVTGYFKLKKDFKKEEGEAPIIYASSVRFVSISDAIDITQRMTESRAYRSGFTSKNPNWRGDLINWITEINKKPDRTSDYIKEIQRLKNVYKTNELKKAYKGCLTCRNNDKGQCPLICRREHHKQSWLHPAHHMNNLDEFYHMISQKDRKPLT